MLHKVGSVAQVQGSSVKHMGVADLRLTAIENWYVSVKDSATAPHLTQPPSQTDPHPWRRDALMPSPLSTDFAAAPWRQRLRDGLGDLAPERRRSLRSLAPAATAQLQPPAAGAALLDLASNDYLGLSRHPAVLAAAAAELAASGLGAGGSRLVTGTRPVHLQLEAERQDQKREATKG